MYVLSALLCAYAGFAALCAITARNVPLVWPKPPSQGVTRALRVAGFLLLALAWVPCYLNWDVPMGTTAWVMILAASGFAHRGVNRVAAPGEGEGAGHADAAAAAGNQYGRHGGSGLLLKMTSVRLQHFHHQAAGGFCLAGGYGHCDPAMAFQVLGVV